MSQGNTLITPAEMVSSIMDAARDQVQRRAGKSQKYAQKINKIDVDRDITTIADLEQEAKLLAFCICSSIGNQGYS